MIRSIFAGGSSRVVRYRQAPAVLSVDHGQKTVLLDPNSEQFYALDGAAQRIWSLLEAPRAAEEIVASLREAYPVSADELAGDVTAFLDEMTQLRLVEAK